ncbi:minichromosome maintenance complex component 3 associated protein [Rhinolophus ferrumequinum]|uniref:Minichromosome maintenance complex component 3 associated protein n=1 Tax=Rhinolophus ferrumequinum TaxID=59479 RepID=A0A7J8AFU9_RHIFE|nr:minichromosome maintenance complex component 3 associated protein [Rhinolophus ferrumequinum]
MARYAYIFLKKHLKNYDVPLSWEQARMQTQKELQLSQECLGMKPSHPAGKFSTPSSLHGHHRGKRSGERGPEGQGPSTEQLMCGASAQELLAQRLSSRLLLEREDSKRFDRQLQQCLSEDTSVRADAPSLPLYLPQTLLSIMPQTLTPVRKTAAAPILQNERRRDQVQLSEATGTSLSERLRHLERLIQTSREEEVASELHLSVLLDMVDL